MLLIISDVHASFPVVNDKIAHAEQALGHALAGVLVLGDFGLFADRLAAFFVAHPAGFTRPLSFIEGNHEDFTAFPDLVAHYADRFTWLPRGSTATLDGIRFLCLGGSAYMDAGNTPRGAIIGERDLERALAHPAAGIDVVISHDCPQGIGVANSPGFEHYGPPGFAGGERLLTRYRPRLWLFGHHHQWFRGEREGTAFHGLPQSWEGYGLLASDLTYTPVPHRVVPPASRWERALQWLRQLFPPQG